MRKLLMGLSAALVVTGCATVHAKQSSHIYQGITMKQATMAALSAVGDAGLAMKSTTTPVDGMTVINAKQNPSILGPTTQLVEFTITLIEPHPNNVQVEINGIINDAFWEGGLVTNKINAFYGSFEKRLNIKPMSKPAPGSY